MKIDILSLFPDMFQGPFEESIIKRAKGRGIVAISIHNFRDFALDTHKTVDGTPCGGGAGMVIRVDILVSALEAILKTTLPQKDKLARILLLDPKGPTFNQQIAQELATLDHLVLIAGHYEGVDERIMSFIDGKISIGNYVLSGGEIAAMAVVDAIVRLLPGAINQDSLQSESFTTEKQLDYPVFTKPQTFRNYAVPEVLKSGDHKKIAAWRKEQS